MGLPIEQVMNADFLSRAEFLGARKRHHIGMSLVAAVERPCSPRPRKPWARPGSARGYRSENGRFRAFAKLIVSEKVISRHDQLSVFDARRIKPDAQRWRGGGSRSTPVGFGRIAAQYAKQALMQHIRRPKRQLIFYEFKDRVAIIISGTVRASTARM